MIQQDLNNNIVLNFVAMKASRHIALMIHNQWCTPPIRLWKKSTETQRSPSNQIFQNSGTV